jgi:peptidoglycan/LPS O-acetylase OafA/YrhL
MPAFLRRRARRLLPPLIAFLAIHTIVVAIIGDSMREELIQVVLALLFVSNWQLTFGHAPPFDLVHLWSLSVEGQLYVVCGLVVSGVRDVVRRSPWTVVGGLVVASLGVAVWRYSRYRAGVDPIALYERTDIRADSMLIGLAMAVVWRSRLASDEWLRWAGAVGGVALAVMMLVATPGAGWLFEGGFTVVSVAGAALVVAATLSSGVVVGIGSWSLLRWLGRISYSLYLWHLPIFIWVVRLIPDAPVGVKIVVSLTSALLVAELAFRLFEERFLAGWRRRGTPGPTQQDKSATPAGADTR